MGAFVAILFLNERAVVARGEREGDATRFTTVHSTESSLETNAGDLSRLLFPSARQRQESQHRSNGQK